MTGPLRPAVISLTGDRADNQDRCLWRRSGDRWLLALADGMGGHARGELAAEAFIDTLAAAFARWPRGLAAPDFLRRAFSRAHAAVVASGQTQRPPVHPLTTGVACVVEQDRLHCAHLGDSRCYLLRRGRILVRTRDHTPVARLLAQGIITPAEARRHPLRNQVNRCLGGQGGPWPPTLTPPCPLQPGDLILLCSDGLWNGVDERALARLARAGDLSRAGLALARQAVRAAAPSADNASLLAWRWQAGPAAARPAGPTPPAAQAQGARPSLDQAIAQLQEALAEYGPEMEAARRRGG